MTNRMFRRQGCSPARAVLVALPLWASACAEPVGPPDVTLFQIASCTAEGNLGLSDVRPLIPVDTMQLRVRTASGPLQVLSNLGDACATAKDPEQCLIELDALPSAPGFHPCATSDCGHVLTTTTGDVVKSYPDTKSLIGFLGPIDTAADAALLVYAQGYNISCSDAATGGVRPALDGNGYEVLASLPTPSCNPKTLTGYQFHVARNASLTYYSTWPIPFAAGALPCP